MYQKPLLFLIALAFVLLATGARSTTEDVRVGIIGLDTPHSIAFTELLNGSESGEAFASYEVVAAYPYGSRTIESSYSRIPKYTRQVKVLGVKITGSIDELLAKVDVVLLETNDGRPHLEQALKVFKAGKPVFIDKPVAASLTEAVAIFEAAERYGVPVFSSSSLRYMENAQAIRRGKIGEVVGAMAYSPAKLEETHPDLYWYGIHGVEALFAVMGTGCETVRRVFSEGTDVVVGTWEDGRIGVFRGIRKGEHGYGGTAFGTEGIAPIGPYEGYRALLAEIVEFFRTEEAPVSREETLEIYAFMTAAQKSKRLGGEPVPIDTVLAEARRQAKLRLKQLTSDK